MNSSGIKVFRIICSGNSKLADIAKTLRKSNSWCSEILADLEKQGFIVKINTKRNRIYQVSARDYAQKLRSLLVSMPAIKFEDFLHETKLDILCLAVFSEKSTQLMADTLNLSRKNIQNQVTYLIKKIVVKKANRKIAFNKEAWPLLYDFLSSYRNYDEINGSLLWKFKNEIVFESQQELNMQKTGFSAFQQYGIPALTIVNTYYSGIDELDKIKVFIHALKKQAIDVRELSMLLAFFIKNKLYEKKKELAILAEKYDCQERFKELVDIYEKKSERYENKFLPSVNRETLSGMLTQHGVKKWPMK